jgi:hypothetical protein
MARLTKKEIIDYIVYEATGRLFFGDGRDTKIALQNFKLEVFRCGAKTMRARLSGLSYQQVLQEGTAALDQIKFEEGQVLASLSQFERAKREEMMRGNRQRLMAAMTANATFHSRLPT